MEHVRCGNLALSRALTVEGGTLVALAAGRAEDALAAAERGLAEAAPGLTPARFNAIVARCQALLALGRPVEAHGGLVAVWGTLERRHYLRVAVTRIELRALRGRAAAGAGALADADRHARLLTREPGLWAQALGAFVAAAVARRAGRPEAGRLTLAAVARLDAAGLGLFAAAARVAAGLPEPLAGPDAGRINPELARAAWGFDPERPC